MEDRVVAVRKRAEVEPKHCLSILLNHGTEPLKPFSKSVFSSMLPLCTLPNERPFDRVQQTYTCEDHGGFTLLVCLTPPGWVWQNGGGGGGHGVDVLPRGGSAGESPDRPSQLQQLGAHCPLLLQGVVTGITDIDTNVIADVITCHCHR